MSLTEQQVRFLEILSDGRRKTYVHVMQGFGMAVTPMSSAYAKDVSEPLRTMGLVKRARGGYLITERGRAALHTTR